MKISLLTATWHYNLGDELILLQEYNILREKFQGAEFNIFTYEEKSSLLPKEDNIKYIPYFPKNIRKKPIENLKYLWENISAIAKSNLIIIWGWWLIYDKEIQKWGSPIWQWKLRILLAKIFFKKIIWLAVGISYPENKAKSLKFLFSGKKTLVSVRDKKSHETLEKIGIKSNILDDSVFSYEPKNKSKISLIDSGSRPEWQKLGLIWISLRRWYLDHEQDNIKQIILYLSRKWYDIVFLSHSIHQEDILADDYIFTRSFALKYNLKITKSIEETLEYYPKLKFVVGMRFHSLILSVVHNIPFLALSYGNKTEELLKDLNYSYQINPRTFEFENFIKIFEALESNENEAKFDLKAKYDTIKEILILDYNNFLNGLERSQK